MEEQRLYKIPYLISCPTPKKAPKAKQAHVVKKNSFPPLLKIYTSTSQIKSKKRFNNKTQYWIYQRWIFKLLNKSNVYYQENISLYAVSYINVYVYISLTTTSALINKVTTGVYREREINIHYSRITELIIDIMQFWIQSISGIVH